MEKEEKRNAENNSIVKDAMFEESSKPKIPSSIVSQKTDEIEEKKSFVPEKKDEISDDQFFDDFFGNDD